MIRVGVLPVRVLRVRVLIPRVLKIVILRVREEYLENTLRARVHADARGERKEAGQKTRAGRKTRDTRHEGWEDPKEEP